MSRAQAQDGDNVAGREEGVGDDALVVKRQGRYGDTVDQGEENLALELRRVVQGREPANDARFARLRETQLDGE